MKAGQIIEEGTHKQLVEADGMYKKLVARQMKKDEIEQYDAKIKDLEAEAAEALAAAKIEDDE